VEDPPWAENPIPMPTMEEAIAFLGPPPKWEDLPEWLTEEPPPPKVQTNREFFIVMPDALLRDTELNPRDREVWMQYYRYCNPKDPRMINRGVTFVSHRRIAKNLGCSVATVERSTAKLIKTGWISMIKRPGFSNFIEVNYRKEKSSTPIKNKEGVKKEKTIFTPSLNQGDED